MKIDNRPLVSIIMPNYNGAAFLGQTIHSVLNQSYTNWELIITDDLSTDDSLEKIKQFNDPRILPPIELKTNMGAAIARNRAIEIAKGELIAFLDNDDLWVPSKLEKQVGFMMDNAFLFTYTDYILFSENDEAVIKCIKKVNYHDLLKNNYILTSTVIYNAKVLGKVYMGNIRKRQDWSLFINIIKKSKMAYCLTESLSYYRRHGNSLSAKKTDLIKYNFNFYNKVLGFSKAKSALLMCRFLIYYFIKKTKERFGWYHR